MRCHKFPIRAWIEIKGIQFNHWNQSDLSKIIINYAQILETSESTLDKSDLLAARMYVGCDDIWSIPTEINVIIGSKCYRAIIKMEA